jgi:nanoRNase/pAp phosphatase (c-di-AMP/oligoRNAs hydrolase)
MIADFFNPARKGQEMNMKCSALPRIVKELQRRKKNQSREVHNALVTIIVDGNFWVALLDEIYKTTDIVKPENPVKSVKVEGVVVICDPYQTEEMRIVQR